MTAFEDGLKVAPGDATLNKGLTDVRRAMDRPPAFGEGPGEGLGKMFSDPGMIAKLSANPKTAPLLADPSFVRKLQDIQKNPQLAGSALQDPRMIQVMGVMMGIDLQAFERPEGSNDLPADLEKNRDEIERQTGGAASSSSNAGFSSTAKPAPKKQEEAPMEVDSEEEKAKAEAEAAKKAGNAAYLKKDFAPAIENYKKAWDLHKDITYLNNLAAAYFEQGNLDESIATCEKAVEEGREMRADYKLVAKAFGRIGSAYSKKGDLDNAIKFWNKSLTEHRTPDILAKLRDAEKQQKENARRAYIDPAKADEERNRGNELYKAGKFADSVGAYSESIKRNPDDPRGYTNRASAYIKLAALPEALKDCDEAIKVDPKNIKAFIRKSTVLTGMKEHSKAMEAIQTAQDLDSETSEKKNSREIQQQMDKVMQDMYAQRANESDEETLQRAMKDPEVAQIMNDPIMQSILQQAQSNVSHQQKAFSRVPSLTHLFLPLATARRTARPHEEPGHPIKDPEARRRRHHPDRQVNLRLYSCSCFECSCCCDAIMLQCVSPPPYHSAFNRRTDSRGSRRWADDSPRS